jgi:hypothetical protein
MIVMIHCCAGEQCLLFAIPNELLFEIFAFCQYIDYLEF